MPSGRFITSLDDLTHLEGAWNGLVLTQERPNPMLTFEWLSEWWKTYRPSRPKQELLIWVLEKEGRLIAALPLYLQVEKSERTIRYLGTGEPEADAVCADYLGPLGNVSDPEIREAVIDTLASLVHEPHTRGLLSDMASDDPWLVVLMEMLTAKEMATRILPGPRCPYLTLPKRFDLWMNGVSSNFRSQIRQSEKFFSELTSPGVRWVGRAEEIEPFWQDLTRLHQLRWTEAGKPGVFSSALFSAFHQSMVRKFLAHGWLWAGTLSSGGIQHAAFYGFELGKRLYFYQSGTDPSAPGKLRPGVLLHIAAIRRAIERGLEGYDFLRGDDPYKQRFTPEARSLSHLEFTRRSLRTTIHWKTEAVLSAARKIRHMIPPDGIGPKKRGNKTLPLKRQK